MSNNINVLIMYVCIILLSILHWKLNNNKCFLTTYTNKICNIDKDIPFTLFVRVDNNDSPRLNHTMLKLLFLVIPVIKLILLN